jgi:hypothetical protein
MIVLVVGCGCGCGCGCRVFMVGGCPVVGWLVVGLVSRGWLRSNKRNKLAGRGSLEPDLPKRTKQRQVEVV